MVTENNQSEKNHRDTSTTRRKFIKGTTAAATAGVLGSLATNTASAVDSEYEREIKIEEHNGVKTYYGFSLEPDRMPLDGLENGRTWVEGHDNVDDGDNATNQDTGNAGDMGEAIQNIFPDSPTPSDALGSALDEMNYDVVGAVENEVDTYTFGGTLASCVIFAGPDEDYNIEGSVTTFDVSGWTGPHEIDGETLNYNTDVRTSFKTIGQADCDGESSRISFDATGELEYPDHRSNDLEDNIEIYANSYTCNSNQDFYNFYGFPSYISMEAGTDESYLVWNRFLDGTF